VTSDESEVSTRRDINLNKIELFGHCANNHCTVSVKSVTEDSDSDGPASDIIKFKGDTVHGVHFQR
jgi:hypothetical protein